MKQISLLVALFSATCPALFSQKTLPGQELTQKIKGIVLDADSKKPLANATVSLLNTGRNTISDASGNFSFNNVPVGRQSLEITSIGYENGLAADVVIGSGKEVFLTIALIEKIGSLEEVTLTASKSRGKPNNEFATVSARSFSMEDTKRYPAAAFDPGRMVQNFAGVSANGDGGNEIIVRGNSPQGVLWRLEGIEIPNPNHFSSLGTSGGAISMLSSSTLGSSDFYTGAFPAEFGNTTAGIFDLNFRNGNKDKREYSFMAGLLGIEAAAEGPFRKGGASSYLINYRYSSVALLTSFLNLGGIVPDYQDLSFKFNFPTKKAGTFTLFGLGGYNKAKKDPEKDSTKWTDDNPNYVQNATSKLGVAGITHQLFLNESSYIKTIFVASGQYAKAVYDTLNPSENYKRVFTGLEKDLDAAYRISVIYNNKLSSKSTLRTGVIASRLSFDYTNNYFDEIDNVWKLLLSAEGHSLYYQGYIQWKYRLNDRITLNTGVHASYLDLNDTRSLEPRMAVSYKTTGNQLFTIAAGFHAKPSQLSTYYYENIGQNNTRTNPNRNLEMNKAIHFVLGYDKTFRNSTRLKTELYYQHLYDIPVERKTGSYFSILNSSSFYDLADIGPLVSDGTGKNYGIDISLEKPFTKNYYFLTTGSLYSSRYTNFSKQEYNTRYNRNYQLNLVAGKEWKRKKDTNKTWGLNAKVLTSGGLRDSEIDLDASQASGKVQYVPGKYYTQSGDPYFRVDIGINFRRNKKQSTHTLRIDFQNLTGQKNLYFSYYDNDAKKIKKEYQTGFFPFLNYRIDF